MTTIARQLRGWLLALAFGVLATGVADASRPEAVSELRHDTLRATTREVLAEAVMPEPPALRPLDVSASTYNGTFRVFRSGYVVGGGAMRTLPPALTRPRPLVEFGPLRFPSAAPTLPTGTCEAAGPD